MSKFIVNYEVIDHEKSTIIGTSCSQMFSSQEEADAFKDKRMADLATCALYTSLKVEICEQKRTLADYLSEEREGHKIDFQFRITGEASEENMVFGYLYPVGKDGETMDLAICGNKVEILNDTKATK